MLESMKSSWTKAHDVLSKGRDKIISKSTQDLPYRVGQMVLLSTKNLPKVTSRKLTQRWSGPFKIVEHVGGSSFKLETPPEMKMHNSFHSSLLKPYVPPARDVVVIDD